MRSYTENINGIMWWISEGGKISWVGGSVARPSLICSFNCWFHLGPKRCSLCTSEKDNWCGGKLGWNVSGHKAKFCCVSLYVCVCVCPLCVCTCCVVALYSFTNGSGIQMYLTSFVARNHKGVLCSWERSLFFLVLFFIRWGEV